MYHPYFRGKKYEVLAIREMTSLMATSRIVPIIEPVNESLKDIELALQRICDAGGQAIVVVNPEVGDHAGRGSAITSLLRETFTLERGISAGVLLLNSMDISKAVALYQQHVTFRPVFIHAGFLDARQFVNEVDSAILNTKHIFFEEMCPISYRRYFDGIGSRVLLRDGFKRRRNADHPPVELFSDLNIEYVTQNFTGFGDFLIVGDEFTEGGGPAYAVAIHITFINHNQGGAVCIYHFVSDENDLPINAPGKFAEALDKLIKKSAETDSFIIESAAMKEFRDLHIRGHFPGLGSIKKLSMKHHLELIAQQL